MYIADPVRYAESTQSGLQQQAASSLRAIACLLLVNVLALDPDPVRAGAHHVRHQVANALIDLSNVPRHLSSSLRNNILSSHTLQMVHQHGGYGNGL